MSRARALVTGGSRGLGEAIAARLAADGLHVVVGYRTKAAAANGVVERIRAAGGSAEAAPVDVSDPASIGSAMEAHGPLALLVSNAGITRDGLFAMQPDEDLRDVIDVNLLGALRCARAAVRPMMAAGGGAIVHVASVAALRASPGQAAYGAAKAGVIALTRTLAAELGPKGIRVNAVVPGLIDAGMVRRMDRDKRDAYLSRIPLGRLGQPDEVADAVSYLHRACYVTGQALVVDGGLSS